MFNWASARFARFEKSYDTSTKTARVIVRSGDISSPAYIKVMGNPEGLHALAAELVGSSLARWLGLRTFDFGVITIDKDDEIPLGSSSTVDPGPAFASKAMKGRTWSGTAADLSCLANPTDTALLVALDTWLLNCDRHGPAGRINYDNVFLSYESAPQDQAWLVAMDHTHTFTCGREFTRKLADLASIRSEQVHGAFPEFRNYITLQALQSAADRMGQLTEADVNHVVESIPVEWQVNTQLRTTLKTFIFQRAQFLATNLVRLTGSLAPSSQGLLPYQRGV